MVALKSAGVNSLKNIKISLSVIIVIFTEKKIIEVKRWMHVFSSFMIYLLRLYNIKILINVYL